MKGSKPTSCSLSSYRSRACGGARFVLVCSSTPPNTLELLFLFYQIILVRKWLSTIYLSPAGALEGRTNNTGRVSQEQSRKPRVHLDSNSVRGSCGCSSYLLYFISCWNRLTHSKCNLAVHLPPMYNASTTSIVPRSQNGAANQSLNFILTLG